MIFKRNRLYLSLVLLGLLFSYLVLSQNSHAQAIKYLFSGHTSILDKDAFRTRQCDTETSIAMYFYHLPDASSQGNRQNQNFAIVDSQPQNSFISFRMGLDDFGTEGFCLNQSSAWKFGRLGPQLSYSLEYSFYPRWSTPSSSANTSGLHYDTLASSVSLTQPIVSEGNWHSNIFFGYENYFSSPVVGKNNPSLPHELEHYLEAGASLALLPNPGFSYALEFVYQYGLSKSFTNHRRRTFVEGNNNVFKVVLNSLTALGPARTPAAQFAIVASGLGQFSQTRLPFFQSCRSGRNNLVFLHAIDTYSADVCFGARSGLRYAISWDQIETSYVELSFDYLTGASYVSGKELGSFWNNLLVSLSSTITPYDGSNIGGEIILGYPIIGSGQASPLERINFQLSLFYNF